MLEVGIIFCLAVVLFLVLKNFPQTGEELGTKKGERRVMRFWKNLFQSKQKDLASIQKEIEKDKEKVLSPKDIETAEKKFFEENPEITKILLESERAFNDNDLRAAEDLAISALSKEKKCGEAYVLLGKIAFQRGQFSDAKEAYRTALRCNLEFAEAYFGLGMAEVREENFTDAIDNLQKAVNLDRSQAEWWAELGKAYMEVRQFAKATKSFKKATSLDIDNREYKQLASEAEEKQRSHAIAFRKKY